MTITTRSGALVETIRYARDLDEALSVLAKEKPKRSYIRRKPALPPTPRQEYFLTNSDAIVSQLLQYHQPSFYNEANGTFSSRGRAALVAECVRKLLHNADPKLRDSRFVAIEGTGAGCYVFLPRIQHQWHPSPFGSGIEAEANTVIRELLKELS